MPFNPFSNDAEDTSFERGSPINQTAQNAAKATASQVQQQQKAFSKDLNDQLYGPTPEMPQKDEKKELPPGMETIQKQMHGDSTDQKQLEETRKKLQDLQRMHKDYVDKTFGETAQKKRMQEEEQERQVKLQEEQEAQEQEARERAAQAESLGGITPRGKSTGPGRQRMQKPIALRLAETKTEINRGTTG